MNQPGLERPFVIQYSEIPLSPERSQSLLQIRPFLGADLLGSSVPDRGVALELVQLPPGGDSAARRAVSRSLLVVLDGRAELVAGGRHAVRAGDVITIPASFAYGIRGAGPTGLEALVISFPEEEEGQSVTEILNSEQLLARNEQRAQATLQTRFFQLLREGELQSPADRRRFRECLRVFSNAFQMLLFTRQATCVESEHATIFGTHLREELGHNQLLVGRDSPPVMFDPVLDATASWFCNQMFLLDNLDKTIVNLVLETAGHHFHLLAEPLFMDDECAKYFKAHSNDLDAEHQQMGVHLLQDQPAQVYRRLSQVLERSWDMFEMMTGRIVQLVEIEREV